MEAKILWITRIEASLEGDKIICHSQQFAILQFIFIDERAVTRNVRVLLIELRGREEQTGEWSITQMSSITHPQCVQQLDTRAANPLKDHRTRYISLQRQPP